MKKYICLLAALFLENGDCHKAANFDDDSLIVETKAPTLEPLRNFPKEHVKYEIFDKFSNDAEMKTRGNLIVTLNQNTKEIIQIDLDENQDRVGEDQEENFKKMCDD